MDEEEILVGKIDRKKKGDTKLEDSVSRKLLTIWDDSYFSRSILKSPNKNICLEVSFESLCNKGEIWLLLKSSMWRIECVYMKPIIKFEVFGQISSMNTDSNLSGVYIFRSALGL